MPAAVLTPAHLTAADLTATVLAPAWCLPFAGVLLSVALGPALFGRRWRRAMPPAMALWAAVLLGGWTGAFGAGAAWRLARHALLGEYLPFVTLLLALFAAGGGIFIRGGFRGTPAGNAAWLALGMAFAGVMGTTGAAMVFIHPFLRANAHRVRKTHLAVFFIVLVGNAGGATSPLGDPPLFLGFLHGVPFWWPLRELGPPLLLLAAVMLTAFVVVDWRLARTEPAPAPAERLHLRGWANIAILLAVVAVTVLTAVLRPGMVSVLGEAVPGERAAAVAAWLALAALSVAITPRAVRQGNMFAWHPMQEVAILFAAVFVTIAPVLGILEAGSAGPAAPLIAATRDAGGEPSAARLFWLTGGLSAVLDNAPTYLVFADVSGGITGGITGGSSGGGAGLRGVAAGAVFFGALTYIGNAPNLMVRAIASHRGVRMPGFLAYTFYACALLLPAFALLTVTFFR